MDFSFENATQLKARKRCLTQGEVQNQPRDKYAPPNHLHSEFCPEAITRISIYEYGHTVERPSYRIPSDVVWFGKER